MALALLGQDVQDATPPAQDDVVVVAERVRRLKLRIKTDRKTRTERCVLRRSSGDPAFDARMCAVSLACAKTARTGRQMEACLLPHVEAYARDLAARRAAAAGRDRP